MKACSRFAVYGNKKGIELSAMFLVTIIMAILIFIFSVYFVWNIFKSGQELEQSLSIQTEEELKSLLIDQNAIVAVYPASQQKKSGSQASFGIGIRNLMRTAQKFKIVASFAGAYSPDGKINFCPLFDECREYVNEKWLGKLRVFTKTIPAGKLEIIPMVAKVHPSFAPDQSTKKGIYQFNICVYDEETAVSAPENDCTMNERAIVYPKGQGRIYKFEISV